MYEGSGGLDVSEDSVAAYARLEDLTSYQVAVLRIAYAHGSVGYHHKLNGRKIHRSSLNALYERGLLLPMRNDHCGECRQWFAPITGAGREVVRRIIAQGREES